MVRPMETEIFEDICREIALDNYGFLYVAEAKDRIKEDYENRDTGLLKQGTLSATDIKQGLRDLSNDEFSDFRKIRNGTYYHNPFNLPKGSEVEDELKHLFKNNMIVNTQTIKSQFGIAPSDVDFFAKQLVKEGYIGRISTGDRDYYRSGPVLRDETSGDTSVEARLKSKTTRGKISHAKLEKEIDIAATSDVIRHLENEGIIIDLGDEYLVEDCIDEYAEFLLDEIGDDIVEEFGDVGILSEEEFNQIVENEITERYDVLFHLNRSNTDDLLGSVEDHLKEDYGLVEDRGVFYHEENFSDYVDSRARQVFNDIDSSTLAAKSDYQEEGHPEIEDVQVTDSNRVNDYVRGEIKSVFDEKVEEAFRVDTDD